MTIVHLYIMSRAKIFFHSLLHDHGTCVDPDGLLHVEGDVPQELSEEEENNKVYSSLDIRDCVKGFENQHKNRGCLSLIEEHHLPS